MSRRKRFSELNQVRVGLVSVLAVALLLGLLLNVGQLTAIFSGTTYTAVFADAAGLHEGDPVRVSGVDVGEVRSIELEGNRVRVEFSTDRELGDETRLEIKSDTLMGAKFLDVRSRGTGTLEAGDEIPIERTDANYDLTSALADLATTTGAIDGAQLAESLDVLSETFADTPRSVRQVLDGTRRLARVVAARDEDLARLLERAESVTGVLAERNVDLIGIVSDSNLLLQALEQRREQIARLFTSVSALTDQLSGFVRDNEGELGPVLRELRRSLRVINDNVEGLDAAITDFSGFARALQESLGSGTFFYGLVGGLAPVNMRPVMDSLLTDLLANPDDGGTP